MDSRLSWRGWQDGGGWLIALLVLLIVVPSACVLWFMSQSVDAEANAARQRVLEVYRGQMRLVRSRLDGVWRAQALRLDARGDPESRFAQIITGEVAEGAVLLAADGTVAYPSPPARTAAAADLDRQIDAASRLAPVSRPAATAAIAGRLNDYSEPLSAADRLELMDRLRLVEPNVWLSTQAALRLSFDLLDAERPRPAPDVVRQTALHDVWALTSADRRVVGLYRTGRIEALMHDFLHEISPAGVVFIAYPPDVRADVEAVAAGPWLPGWQLSFVPLDSGLADEASRRRRAVYQSVASVGVAVVVLVGLAAGGGLRRHLQLARLRTDLVAAASHELRTPLASMRVLVDGLLADSRIDPSKARDYLQLLSVENARLTRLIDNFLTFSRLDGRRYRFVLEPVEARAIVTAAVEAVQERRPAGCDLRVEVAGDLPLVRADATALPTALANLLDNAFKYTPDEKRVVVRAYRDGERFVSFAVADNGIGIPRREQRRVFRRFYRVDQRLARETGGVGLGLSIVALIVRGHGGRVRVESGPGGSTFVIQVPVASAAGRG